MYGMLSPPPAAVLLLDAFSECESFKEQAASTKILPFNCKLGSCMTASCAA
jgi:hypothetical protein